MSQWNDLGIQFPRLLAKINAVGLSEEQLQGLSESMGLELSRIDELFERAHILFELSKARVFGKPDFYVDCPNCKNGFQIIEAEDEQGYVTSKCPKCEKEYITDFNGIMVSH